MAKEEMITILMQDHTTFKQSSKEPNSSLPQISFRVFGVAKNDGNKANKRHPQTIAKPMAGWFDETLSPQT